ncbi:MAG: metal-sensing transcriptional repressor [Veillonella sp.]|nr:metal-sensing transcriptional repressor [Veillonella sp.]
MKQCMDSENLHRRLRKILGQVQAIDRMIEEDIPEMVSNMVTWKKPLATLQKL